MKLSPLILFRKEFDGTGIIFDPVDNKSFALNKISAFICEMLQDGCELEDIVDKLKKNVQGVPDTVQDDVKAFLAELEQRNYLGE